MKLQKMFPLVLMALFLWMGCATAAPSLTLKVAAGDPEDSEMGVVGKSFKKYIEEKTKGDVEIVCFYSGALGDESECLRNVQKGTLPLAIAGIANLVPFEKRLGLLTLPYLFSNLDEVVTGTNGAAAELLNTYATKSGFRILTWTYTDFRYISNSKRPITKMADMAGLKFRVPQSAVLIAAYKAFGGSPTPISWSETFTALQQGVVDGQCYGYIGFKANKFNEANQKYLTEVHYTYQLQPLVISERVFRKLKPELQKLVIEAGQYAQEEVLKYQIEQANAAKQELIAQGLQVSELEDEDAWKKAALEKVWPEMADFVGGKETINAYLKACGKPAWN
ncbi:TRAP transporter substrate-binding protein [uncultured Bilophila sp.]|uniref:TRAP transporter substrate-binding protein n=1 Tax=uncultured Bilophila sp. TaxID=529385 RepID=UPI0025DE5516|nr:TRAP transporter substrate-binding protein [uncultured Bilophila sp.]